MKKLLITILTLTAAFLFAANFTNIEASSEWTLDNGYYYYNKDVKFDEEVHYLVSNGNPIFIKDNDTDIWMIYDYKIAIKAKINPSFGQDAVVQYATGKRDSEGYNTLYYPVSYATYEDHSFTEESKAPITIRYSATLFNPSSPGDLSLPGYGSFNLIKASPEEFEFVGWPRQYGIQIKHNYAIADINDPNFVKYNLKIFYHEHYLDSVRQGIMYDLEKVIFKVEKSGIETQYWKLVTSETEIINVSSFNELPITIGNFDNGLNGLGFVFVDKVGNNYQLQVNYDSKIYQLLVDTVPEFIAVSKKVYYFTDKGQRFLTGFYDNEVKWTETSELHTNLMENSYIIWNMSTGQYMNSGINFVPARLGDKKHSWTDARRLYADIVIPHSIDDLLAISVSYKYQYHYLNGSKGAWITVNEQILLKDGTSPGQPSWWTAFILIPYKNITHQYPVDEIKEITVTNGYKLDYLEWLNDSIAEDGSNYDIPVKTYEQNEIFPIGSKAYSLYLGTFNKFWSTGVGAKDFTILQYRYEYKGVEFSNPYPQTLAPEYTPPNRGTKPPDWFTKFIGDIWAWIVQFSYIAIPVIGLITSPFIIKVSAGIFGKKVYKKRGLIVIAWVGFLLAAWYLLLT